MEAIATIIDQLKEKFQQPQKPEVEPDILPGFINQEDALAVRKIKGGYIVEDLHFKKDYTVTKLPITGEVLCSCDNGKSSPHCKHKVAVWQEAQLMKKLKLEECQKRRALAGISSYIRTVQKIIATYEQKGDVRNSNYWFFKGKLAACKHNLRTIIES